MIYFLTADTRSSGLGNRVDFSLGSRFVILGAESVCTVPSFLRRLVGTEKWVPQAFCLDPRFQPSRCCVPVQNRMLSPHFSCNSSEIFARIRSRLQTESSSRLHPDPFKVAMQSRSFADKMENCSRDQFFIAGITISSATFARSISLRFPYNHCKSRRASVYLLGFRRCCSMLDGTRGDR